MSSNPKAIPVFSNDSHQLSIVEGEAGKPTVAVHKRNVDEFGNAYFNGRIALSMDTDVVKLLKGVRDEIDRLDAENSALQDQLESANQQIEVLQGKASG